MRHAGSYGSKVPNIKNVTPPPAAAFDAVVQLTLHLASSSILGQRRLNLPRNVGMLEYQTPSVQTAEGLFKQDLGHTDR